jgi:benzoyl-CoA-dihydrodiol lyase
MFAIITAESCFAGTLAELAFAADRTYMLQTEDDPPATIMLSGMSGGSLPMPTGESRLAARLRSSAAIDRVPLGVPVRAIDAADLGLVTAAPDELDWEDELRQAIESRIALSPDALTGMEANLRFPLPETQASRIFGRLSAWQNWIFTRPNAVGPDGALTVYGTGVPTKFDWTRV